MCGFYITNNSISEEVFSERLDRIKFRGPDFTGIAAEDGIWFGHHRLSILDLDERSNQPMSLDDLVLCYNGEIYNYI
jgi:asparagine synthase (glutamine-hydrolysing)